MKQIRTIKKQIVTLMKYAILHSGIALTAVTVTVAHQGDLEALEREKTASVQNHQANALNLQKTALKNVCAFKSLAKENSTMVHQKIQKMQSTLTQSPKYKYQGALYFVSLSMPKETLQALAKESDYYGIPLMLNGLYQGDFYKTALKLYEIIKPTGETEAIGGFLIDPNWFEMYGIKEVPALVITEQNEACHKGLPECKVAPFDIIKGNITIKGALEKIAQKGEFKDVAKRLLQQGKSHA